MTANSVIELRMGAGSHLLDDEEDNITHQEESRRDILEVAMFES